MPFKVRQITVHNVWIHCKCVFHIIANKTYIAWKWVHWIRGKFPIPTNNGTLFVSNVAWAQVNNETKTKLRCHLQAGRIWVQLQYDNGVSFITILMLHLNIIHPFKKSIESRRVRGGYFIHFIISHASTVDCWYMNTRD